MLKNEFHKHSTFLIWKFPLLLVFSFLLTSCGGGGGGGPPPQPITFQDPGDNDGWWGEHEFATRLRPDQKSGTQITIVISDFFMPAPGIRNCNLAGDRCHGEAVSQIVSMYAFGTVEEHHDENFFDVIDTYSGLTPVHIHSLSRPACLGSSFIPSSCLTHDRITDKGAALVIATGNDASIPFPNSATQTDANLVFETGLVIWAGGLARDRMGKHEDATQCGVVMQYCILAPYEAEFIHPVSTVTSTIKGTSFSTPQVASALSMLRTRWPQLDNRMAISLALTTAMDLGPPGVDAETGWGALDFRNLFSPVGDLRLPSSTTSLRAGVLKSTRPDPYTRC